MGRLVFFLEPLDTPHHGQTWSWWGRERCSGQRQGLLTVRLWLTTSPALGSTWSTRWVFTRAPTCPLVTTLSPSLWCCLPSFSLSQNIYILSPYWSIEVLRVVTSDFQNYLNYLNIILRKQNLYLFKKRISGYLWFIWLWLVWSY